MRRRKIDSAPLPENLKLSRSADLSCAEYRKMYKVEYCFKLCVKVGCEKRFVDGGNKLKGAKSD